MTRSQLTRLRQALEAKHDGVRLLEWEFENFRKWQPTVAPIVDNAEALIEIAEAVSRAADSMPGGDPELWYALGEDSDRVRSALAQLDRAL